MSLSLQDILFASNDHADYIRRLERAYEQLQTSLETAKKDHKRIREMRKWDDYDKLYKKYLKKCAQLADAKKVEGQCFDCYSQATFQYHGQTAGFNELKVKLDYVAALKKPSTTVRCKVCDRTLEYTEQNGYWNTTIINEIKGDTE